MANSAEQFKYDVFLSYNERGAGSFFSQQLHEVFIRSGFRSYRCSEDLDDDKEIPSAVTEAIKASRIHVIILSKDYASSASCLRVLVKILDQIHQIGGSAVPLFCGVEPSLVRYQEAMMKHEKLYEPVTVARWREALTEIGNMFGCTLGKNESEADFAHQVAEGIGSALRLLKAPTASKPASKVSFWKEDRLSKILFLMFTPLTWTPSLLLLATGAAAVFPIGGVIVFVSVNVAMSVIPAAMAMCNVQIKS